MLLHERATALEALAAASLLKDLAAYAVAGTVAVEDEAAQAEASTTAGDDARAHRTAFHGWFLRGRRVRQRQDEATYGKRGGDS